MLKKMRKAVRQRKANEKFVDIAIGKKAFARKTKNGTEFVCSFGTITKDKDGDLQILRWNDKEPGPLTEEEHKKLAEIFMKKKVGAPAPEPPVPSE